MGNASPFAQPDEPKRARWSSVSSSIAIHLCAIAAIALLPASRDSALFTQRRSSSAVTLVAPRLEKLVKPVIIAEHRIQVPPTKSRPFTLPPPPAREMRSAMIEPAEALVTRQPATVLMQPAPHSELLAAGTVGMQAPKAPPHEVKAGGFGDRNGVPPSPDARKGLAVARVGSFELPQGQGNGGNGGNAVVVGKFGAGEQTGKGSGGGSGNGVVVGGFGTGEPSGKGSGEGRSGSVRAAGFGDHDKPEISASQVAKTAPPVTTPVEILSKPKPAYSEEARAKKLEGEVALEVLFAANGEIRVLRLVRGLGLGLDQNAEAAATRIRFRPGTRDGRPVDMTGIVRIVFQLL